MSNNSGDNFAAGLFFGSIFGFVAGAIIFASYMDRQIRDLKKDAIKNNVAFYDVNQETGVSEFKFFTFKKSEKKLEK